MDKSIRQESFLGEWGLELVKGCPWACFFVGKGLAAVEFIILSVQISNIGNNLAFTVFIGRGGDGDRLAHASAGEGLGLCLLWLSIRKHCCQS